MAERWKRELTKLRAGELPDGLWDRVTEGPRMEPLREPGRSQLAAAAVAVVVFVLAAAFAFEAFGPFRADRTLSGPDVLTVPARGQAEPAFLPEGRPIFVVHHEDGTVTVVDALSSHHASASRRSWSGAPPRATSSSGRTRRTGTSTADGIRGGRRPSGS